MLTCICPPDGFDFVIVGHSYINRAFEEGLDFCSDWTLIGIDPNLARPKRWHTVCEKFLLLIQELPSSPMLFSTFLFYKNLIIKIMHLQNWNSVTSGSKQVSKLDWFHETHQQQWSEESQKTDVFIWKKRVGLVQLKVADKGNTNTVQQWTWPSINSTAKHPASQNPTFCKSQENPTQIYQ